MTLPGDRSERSTSRRRSIGIAGVVLLVVSVVAAPVAPYVQVVPFGGFVYLLYNVGRWATVFAGLMWCHLAVTPTRYRPVGVIAIVLSSVVLAGGILVSARPVLPTLSENDALAAAATTLLWGTVAVSVGLAAINLLLARSARHARRAKTDPRHKTDP